MELSKERLIERHITTIQILDDEKVRVHLDGILTHHDRHQVLLILDEVTDDLVEDEEVDDEVIDGKILFLVLKFFLKPSEKFKHIIEEWV